MAEPILKVDHYHALNRALERIAQTKATILEPAARAGLPMEKAAEELEHQQKLAEALKAQFFPGLP